MWRYWLCPLFVTVLCDNATRESKVVRIESGPVRGYKDPDTGVFQFFGIPYATAPTGVNKFKAPLPASTWEDIRDPPAEEIMCHQTSSLFTATNVNIIEDCLVANIHVPDTTEDNLPVVVYVHGGGFQIGYGNMVQPMILVKEHNIIFVSFNYRLGVHGFLCLGTEDVPGNAGLKDQVALLRWVKNNIASFGGNPEDVTIAGASAGSAAVDLIMLSKSATGLFTKVIPESGSNAAAFAIQQDPLENAKYFAKVLKFNNVDDIVALEQFYKTASFEQLTSDSFGNRPDSTFLFSTCIERTGGNNEIFLDESPLDILKNGNFKRVPLLYGFANMEGLMRIVYFDDWKIKMNKKFSDFLPADLKFPNEEEKEQVAFKIRNFYFGDNPIDNDQALAYVDYFSDIMIAYPTLRSVQLQVENGHDQIYLYVYSFVDEETPVVPYTNVKGANHCAQTLAVVAGNVPSMNMVLTEEFKNMSRIVRRLWGNFIKSGKPVPEGSTDLPAWPAVSGRWSPHMSLGNELQLKGSLLHERTLFWDDIYSKYYREPVPPPAPPTKRSEL